MTKQPDLKLNPVELEKRYFQEASAWELDSTQKLRQSERRAWYVAGSAVLIAVLAMTAVLCLLPLKQIEPFVVRVDNATGVVDVVQGLRDGQTTYDEAINKYWLGQYLLHRERYLPETVTYDRNVVGIMSNAATSQTYAAFTDPRRNPNAPMTLYGNTARVDVQIKNISFINPEKNVALIRYSRLVERSGQQIPATHWVATIAFTYQSAPMSEKDRLLNPLGFQVTDYRNDPETVQGE